MFDRASTYSTARQFAHLHPFYSALGATLGPVATLIYGWEYFPLALVSLNLGRELWNEFKHIKEPVRQVEKIFDDADVMKGNLKTGQLRYHDKMPLVEVYTSDPHLHGEALGTLLARHYLDFYTEYFWYLFTIARLGHGPRGRSAIQFINEEIRRRHINFDSDTVRLHYILKKMNEALAQYNKNAPFYLQRSNAFSMDHLRAMMAFCEVEKGLGANGCSTSVISGEEGIKYFIRNLDWFKLGSFQKYLVSILQPTEHVRNGNPEKPQATLSSTVIPGAIQAITAFNESLGIAYNEVGGKSGNRENSQNAYPGLSLVQLIAENCKTMEEVELFLKTHQPASQNNLIVTTSTKDGIIESLPLGSSDIYRIRGQNDSFRVATNHFLDEKEQPLVKSACVPCSMDRYNKMHKAIDSIGETKPDLSKIAESSATPDTVQTFLAEFNHLNGEILLQTKVSNGYAPTAPDAKGSTGYTTLRLDQLFKEFAQDVQSFNAAYTHAEQKQFSDEKIVDTSLINLMNKSNEISGSYPKLARELSDLYSILNEQLARQEVSCSAELSRDEIGEIAEGTITAIDAILSNQTNNASEIEKYESLLNRKLPKNRMIYDKTKMVDALFTVFMCVSFDMLAKYCMEKSSSIDLSLFACSSFMYEMSGGLSRGFTGLISGVSLAAFSMFNKPKIISSVHKVLESLNEVCAKRATR